MASSSIFRTASAALIVLILATCGVLGAAQASQPAPPTGGTKRAIPVKNVVPAGAAEFKGTLIKLEVIEALNVRRSDGTWDTRMAVRYKNVRGDRLRCSLQVVFDKDHHQTIHNIDLPAGETDLATLGAGGKRAGELSKFTAYARDIRIGG